ncbi:hypothetical protein Acor_81550 [Acrocarpospora corrugata]|uniref:Uncharacterized protein n=1 Tax=Acrocarpospora corrugata TaxID=35763 RepID=A0A5M3WB93_9ACTN|nr:hypothetical protein Acor_81550 [Acrocarpospora corrugata]
MMTYLDGGPPETRADWRRVAGTLRELHRLTRGWPQRPGWRSSTDLLRAETGTRIPSPGHDSEQDLRLDDTLDLDPGQVREKGAQTTIFTLVASWPTTAGVTGQLRSRNVGQIPNRTVLATSS